MRDTKFNPLAAEPPACPCGAPAARGDADEAKKKGRPQLCHLCRYAEAGHPEWSVGEVVAAGKRKWLECALAGVRALARTRPGEPTLDVVFPGVLEWTVKDGYERLSIIGAEPGPVVETLSTVHPDLVIAQRARAGETFALRLVPAEAERRAAA